MSEVLVKCSEVSIIKWEDCEPSIENFWINMRIADVLNSLQTILMLSEYYFDTFKDKLPSHLILENKLNHHVSTTKLF